MIEERVIQPGQLWRHRFSGLRARVTFIESTGWVGVYYPPERRDCTLPRGQSPYAGYWDTDLIENFERVS